MPVRAGHHELSTVKILPSNIVCKTHDALCAIWFNGAIRIEHAITDNLPDGVPVLPGFVNDGIFWAVVAPLPEGRMRWRRISLQQNMVRPLGVQDEAVNHSRRHTLKGNENETR
jgi:hypothetical protein